MAEGFAADHSGALPEKLRLERKNVSFRCLPKDDAAPLFLPGDSVQGERLCRKTGDDKLFAFVKNPGENQKSARSHSFRQQAAHLHQRLGKDIGQNQRILTGNFSQRRFRGGKSSADAVYGGIFSGNGNSYRVDIYGDNSSAPKRAAAMPSTPEPQPTSRTPSPRTRACSV